VSRPAPGTPSRGKEDAMSAFEVSDDVYERLADALDALPAGFTRTPSKSEIRLMQLVFTPEEAAVASQMTRTPETAAEIAKRVGLPEAEVTVLLESMIPRAMVRAGGPALEAAAQLVPAARKAGAEAAPSLKPEAERAKEYRLNPFLIGWYEAFLKQDHPTSKEFSEVYERYVIEGGGERVIAPRPGSLGVIPMRGSLKPEWLEREPHNDIDAHFQRHERFLVIDCVCKKQKAHAHGHSCDMPLKRCGFVGMPPSTPLSENVLTREEAMKLWAEFDAMGTMVVQGAYGFTLGAKEPQFVGGCHCCGCCCALLNASRLDPNLKETAQRSNYRAVKDYEKCHACGECVRRCQVLAHTFDQATDDKPVYHPEKCIGCGACGMGCPTGALHLEPVSEEEWFHVPSSFLEWEEKRLEFLAAQK